MTLSKTTGIVLSQIKYKENNYIVHVFTKAFGKTAFLVHAPQSKRAKIRSSHLLALNLLEMEVNIHNKKDLHQIKEVQMAYTPNAIASDPMKAIMSLFIAELVDKSLHESEPDEALFSFLSAAIQILDQSKSVKNYHLWFMLKYSRYLGFYPSKEADDLQYMNPPEKAIFIKLIEEDYSFSRSERRALLKLFIEYYRNHLPSMKKLKSLSVLESIFD